MFVDHIAQFYEGVIPAYEAYNRASKEIKGGAHLIKGAAIQAANVLFHYREALVPLFPKDKFTRKEVAKLSSEFDLLGDVFNSTKHKELIRSGKLIEDSSSVYESVVCSILINDQQKHRIWSQWWILVKTIEGEERDLLEISTNVINFWVDLLYDHKMINSKPFFRYENNDPSTFPIYSDDDPFELINTIPGRGITVNIRNKKRDPVTGKVMLANDFVQSKK